MVCLSVLAYNPRDLVSGLSSVQMETHGIPIPYHLHQCAVDFAHYEIFRGKVGKSGVMKRILIK